MFSKIVVAVAFNHHLEVELACASMLSKEAELHIVHVGQVTDSKLERLNQKLNKLNIINSHIHWLDGDKVESLLEFTQQIQSDLLITATDDESNLLKYFTGSIPKNLCRKCRCSILLLQHQEDEKLNFDHIVVSGVDHPKTPHTVEVAIKMSKKLGAKYFTLLEEVPVDQLVLSVEDKNASTEFYSTESTLMNLFDNKQQVDELIKELKRSNLEIIVDHREGKPGYCVAAFAKENKANLLVLNSPDMELGIIDRLFPHDIEYALSSLPCSLLVVHPNQFEFN